MNRFRLFSIIACFAFVFVLGGGTAWLLKPTVPAGARHEPLRERVLDNLDARLKLAEQQKTRIAAILEEWEREVGPVYRRPRRRYEIFQKYAPRIREVLTPAQHVGYDEIVQEIRERFERRIR